MAITIAEVRQKYPQYSDLSDQELSDALHQNYYSDMPKAEFESSIGLKPQDYQRKPSLTERIMNLPVRAALWMQEHPKEAAATGIETAAQISGGLLGGLTSPVTGPVGPVVGGTAAYTGARQLTGALGLREPEPVSTSAGTGLLTEVGGRLVMAAPGAVSRAWQNLTSPEIRASNLLRSVVGPTELQNIQAANVRQPNVLASQAAANVPNISGYQTLVREAEQTDPLELASKARVATQQSNQATLNDLAGGANATERLQSRNAARDELNKATGAIRESELNAANENTQKILELQKQATGARTAAAQSVEDVRRMASFTDKLNDWARNWAPGGKRLAGAPIPPTEFTYPGELIGRAEETGVKAAQESLTQGEIARNAEASLADMEAKGLKPLSVDNITAQISRTVKDPEIGTNEKLTKALLHIKGMLEDWSSKGGIIDAKALNAIRKNGINSAVDAVAGDLDPEGKAKLAASVLSNLKPSIDSAIKSAGGKKWGEYLAAHTEGSHNIDKQELYGVLAKLYSDPNKSQFISLVKGDNPELVHKIFGYGDFDIKSILGNKYQQVANMAKQAESEIAITEAANKGGKIVAGVLEKTPTVNKLATLFGGKIALANKFVEGLKGNVSKSTMDAIMTASKSGKSMNELLATLPYNQQQELMRAFSSSKFGGAGMNVLANQLQGQQ